MVGWNPFNRGGEDGGGASTRVSTADADEENGGGAGESAGLHSSLPPPGSRRRSKSRCMGEICVLGLFTLVLVVGLAAYYSTKETDVSGLYWSDDEGDPDNLPVPPPSAYNESGSLTFGAEGGEAGNERGEDEPPSPPPENVEEMKKEYIKAANVITPSDDLANETSPQYRALQWMLLDDPRHLDPRHNASFRQRYILSTFYFAAAADESPEAQAQNGPAGRFHNWLTADNECFWGGITCGPEFPPPEEPINGLFLGDETSLPETVPPKDDPNPMLEYLQPDHPSRTLDLPRPVIALDLANAALPGRLPDEISALETLVSLKLSRNDIGGSLPVTLGSLEDLVFLHLDRNRLEGPIHESVGELTALRELDLGYNNFTGTVPALVCDLALDVFHYQQHTLPGVECQCCSANGTSPDSNDGGSASPTGQPPPPDSTESPQAGDKEEVPPVVEGLNSTHMLWSQIGSDINGSKDATLNDFGFSVVLSRDGSRLGVGSVQVLQLDEGKEGRRGVVDVYERPVASGERNNYSDEGSDFWTQVGPTIIGFEDQSGEREFAISLSGNGNRVVLSSYTNRGASNGTASSDELLGRVQVFDFDGSSWEQSGPNITGKDSSFGSSLSVSNEGSYVAVGAPFDDGGRGRADVYQQSADGSWEAIGAGEIGQAQRSQFGSSVSLSGSGNHVAVSALATGLDFAGTVQVYEVFSDWRKKGSEIDIVSTTPLQDRSVSLSDDGNRVAVCSSKEADDRSIAVSVNDFNGVLWDQSFYRMVEYDDPVPKQVGSHLTARECSVSLSAEDGTSVAIGLPGNGTGRADVYGVVQEGGSAEEWKLLATFTGDSAGDAFGSSVFLSADGDTVAAGSPASSSRDGYVRVFGSDSPP